MGIKDRLLEIVNESEGYYLEDMTRRSLNDKGQCVYKGPDGNRCAVGRYICEDDIDRVHTWEQACMRYNHSCAADDLVLEFGESILQPEVHGVPALFWLDLQSWHDGGFPRSRLEQIKRRIEGDYYD